MPLYEIQHICHLTPSQMDELASAITSIHSTKFTTPKMFVNVKFTDASSTITYVAGKRRQGNHILANVRVGASRTHQDWNDLTRDMVSAWNSIVPMPQAKGSKQQDYSLRSFILLGGLVGGYEAGFLIPKAGEDVQWLRDNWEEFEMKAKGGDEEFQELVEEIKGRGILGQANGRVRRRSWRRRWDGVIRLREVVDDGGDCCDACSFCRDFRCPERST